MDDRNRMGENRQATCEILSGRLILGILFEPFYYLTRLETMMSCQAILGYIKF
jgi:hypothetical protein